MTTTNGWTSGWLGISAYTHTTHGFVVERVESTGVEFAIYWLGPDGEVHNPFHLRYNEASSELQRVVNFTDGEDEDQEEVDESITAPAMISKLLSDEARRDKAFSIVAASFDGMFYVLDEGESAYDNWDHDWKPGPPSRSLWHPMS